MSFQYERPPHLTTHIHSLWLHHRDPYLRLGPFACELQLHKPEIAVIHNFMLQNECRSIINETDGKMAASPLFIPSADGFVNGRSSKMTFLSDEKYPIMKHISQRVQLITKFNLNNEKFASENFKVMNYGLGGKITGHWDSTAMFTGMNDFQL